ACGVRGHFFSDELTAIYTFQLRDGALTLRTRKDVFPLQPSDSRDTFTGDLGQIAFTRTRSQRINGFTITTGRIRNLRFRKTQKYRGQASRP
ncbi:MAG TPA: hypothetical protein VKT32_07110, partial [Chthonomonadaceae bacterium]|nr:hypothetical protein [Chthonomonadaceae bacterium]